MVKKKEEPEVITFKEIVERNKNIPEEELYKFVLVCKNCQHKDLLKNFIKKRQRDWDIAQGEKPTLPWKPYPYPKPSPWKPISPYKRYRMTSKNGKSQVINLVLNGTDYEDMFFCPKCHSSLVVLCEDFVKNNILRGLDNG